MKLFSMYDGFEQLKRTEQRKFKFGILYIFNA